MSEDDLIRERLMSAVKPVNDPEAIVAEIEARRSPRRRRIGHRGLVVGAAAAAIVLVGATLIIAGPAGRQLAAVGDTPATGTDCANPPLYIYMLPGPYFRDATAGLFSTLGHYSLESVDSPMSREELEARFGDEPGYASAVAAGETPETYLAVLGDLDVPNDTFANTTAGQIRQIERIDGVLGVDRGKCSDIDPQSATTTMVKSTASVPGAGVVDQWQGPMVEAPAFEPDQTDANLPMTPGEPVLVGDDTDDSLRGFVTWNDLYPTYVPASRETPAPMVPVTDASGKQIAWWAAGLGWISFDEVEAPGFDYRAEYTAVVEENAKYSRPPQHVPADVTPG